MRIRSILLVFAFLLILPLLLFGCGKTGGGVAEPKTVVSEEPLVPPPPEEKTFPTPIKISAKTQCVYHGAFLGDDKITLSAIQNFENMSGKKLDIVLKFLAFSNMSVDGGFPKDEAEIVSSNGGVLFIKLEPWSCAGADDNSFSLSDIIAGKYDGRIASFANEAAKYGKPLFISFAHEMNANWYPWSGDTDLYIKAYRHVHDLMEKYCHNITWVWNPNVDGGNFTGYYPGDDYVDWVAVDGYNTEDYGASWRYVNQIFSASLVQLEFYKKHIMIAEMACDSNNDYDENTRKPDWLYNGYEWLITKQNSTLDDNLIKAVVYFNFDKIENGKLKKWAISGSYSQTKYKEILDKYPLMLKHIDL